MKKYTFMLFLLCGIAESALGGQLEDGKAALVRNDYSSALGLLRPLAQGGDVEAQYLVGFMYRKGMGTAKDYAEAAAWFRKAADQNDAESQDALGQMYRSGEGVPQDLLQGYMWTKKAAGHGDAQAQLHLSRIYYAGEGVGSDRVLAYMWLILAVEHATPQQPNVKPAAIRLRNQLKTQLSAKQLANAEMFARDWTPK
jgi:TPR repeat protein